jgi:hypothetical protein
MMPWVNMALPAPISTSFRFVDAGASALAAASAEAAGPAAVRRAGSKPAAGAIASVSRKRRRVKSHMAMFFPFTDC